MNLLDTVIFSLVVVTFIIGVHQTILHGLGNAYWIFMFSTSLLLLYWLRKNNREKKK